MPIPELPKEFIDLCQSITDKRPKTVIEHILKHGHITTEELKNIYGYNHPPRAARDVRECGIPLDTFRVTGSDGRKIGAYRFGDPTKIRVMRMSGRTGLSKQIKDFLIEKYGSKCFIYQEKLDAGELQIDHRVPYEVGGDDEEINPEDFMLLCGSANRAKSWSCEHCQNWNEIQEKEICLSCYWAFPESYNHVAMREVRRIDLLWQGREIEVYEKLKDQAHCLDKELPEFVKEVLSKIFNK